MSRGWNQSIFSCVQQQNKSQWAQTEAERKFYLNLMGYFFTVSDIALEQVTREAVESTSLEICKTCLDAILHNAL